MSERPISVTSIINFPMVYRAKVCLICGKEYQPTSGVQKYCAECGPKVHCKGRIIWALAHPERVKEIRRCSAAAHPEVGRAWAAANPENIRKKNKRSRMLNPGAQKIWAAANPEKRRVYDKKGSAKRRVLGFTALNAYFEGADAHHIDKEHVVYIPKAIHRVMYHNIWTGRNMDKINALALQWLGPQ